MKGFGKRLAAVLIMISLLTVAVSAASFENCPGGCSHLAAIGTTHYDTLEEAAAAVTAGGTVTLLKDTVLSAPLTFDKSMGLDLGGKTLTGNLQFTGGGTIRNGKLLAASGTALTVANCTVAIEKAAVLEGCGEAPTIVLTASKDGKTRLNVSGTVSGKGPAAVIDARAEQGKCELYILKNTSITAEENPAIFFDCAGKLEISGGTVQTKKDAVSVSVLKDRKTEISVTGGKFLTESGEAILLNLGDKAEAPREFVTGGTFTKVPEAFLPTYSKITANADKTYTVVSSYTITYLPGDGSGSMETVKIPCGSKLKLPKNGFTAPKGKDFAGWEADGKTYGAGDTLTPQGDLTVTAQWKTHKHSGGQATCMKKAVCKTCGKTYGSFGSHSLSYVDACDATCEKPGTQAHQICVYCGECYVDGAVVSADSVYIAPLGHNWETQDAIPATCEDGGMKAHEKCANCAALRLDGNPVTEEDLLIPAAGHTLEAVAATQATCSEPGIQAHEHCAACDQDFVNGKPVAIGDITSATASHVLSDWQSDDAGHWKACVDCQEVFRQKAHADADSDGICDECGYEMGKTADTGNTSGFSWLFLIPIAAAVGIAVPLAMKKRK